jgi:hypothetical protein
MSHARAASQRSARLLGLLLLPTLVLAAPSRKSAPLKREGTVPATVLAAGRAMDPARLEADVRALADDAMEGRGTGTAGYDRAARFVADRMKALGLEPGGEDG